MSIGSIVPPIPEEETTKPPPKRKPTSPKPLVITKSPLAETTIQTSAGLLASNQSDASNLDQVTEGPTTEASFNDKLFSKNSTTPLIEPPASKTNHTEKGNSEKTSQVNSEISDTEKDSSEGVDQKNVTGQHEILVTQGSQILQSNLTKEDDHDSMNVTGSQSTSTVRSTALPVVTKTLKPRTVAKPKVPNRPQLSHCPQVGSLEKRLDRVDLFLNATANIGFRVSNKSKYFQFDFTNFWV